MILVSRCLGKLNGTGTTVWRFPTRRTVGICVDTGNFPQYLDWYCRTVVCCYMHTKREQWRCFEQPNKGKARKYPWNSPSKWQVWSQKGCTYVKGRASRADIHRILPEQGEDSHILLPCFGPEPMGQVIECHHRTWDLLLGFWWLPKEELLANRWVRHMWVWQMAGLLSLAHACT